MLIDLHMHLLPGLDDGAKDIDISREMLRLAAADGTRLVYATPHLLRGAWEIPWETIVSAAADLDAWAAGEGLDIRVRPGAEIAADPSVLDSIERNRYTLGESRYVLVELPSRGLPDWLEDFFFQLMTRDLVPVIAHPERHPAFQRSSERLVQWTAQGVCLQVNAGSLSGRMGPGAEDCAHRLARAGLVHGLGSDAHSVGHRRPDLRGGLASLASLSLPAAAGITSRDGLPRAIAENRPYIPPAAHLLPAEDSTKNTLWSRLRCALSSSGRT